MDVFSSKPGSVFIYGGDDGGSIPGRVEIEGFQSTTAVIIDAEYRQATNQQFQSSLMNTIYMYVFGDQMGAISIKGYIFAASCTSGISGVEEVLSYYKDNRAAKKSAAVIVKVGDTKISGFLTQMNISTADPVARINAFTFQINSMPESDGSA